MKLKIFLIIIGYIMFIPVMILIPWLMIMLLPALLIIFSTCLILSISAEKVTCKRVIEQTRIDLFYTEDHELDYILFKQKENIMRSFAHHK